jgi:hypothetical protein
MPLVGTAFVIMWHDIAPEADGQYNLWHTHEHMPERIALPGFLRARRGVNKSLDRQHYFTLYECESLASVVSPEYQQSLNFPTAWTQRVAPKFRNFKRMSCETAFSSSRGIGGSFATFRAPLPAGVSEAQMVGTLTPAVDPILALSSVTGIHIAFARSDYTNGETTEVQIRPMMAEPDFGLVVVVEGIGLAEITADLEAIGDLLAKAGLSGAIAQTYDMAYMLDVGSAA